MDQPHAQTEAQSLPPPFSELSESGRTSAVEVAGDINEIVDEHGDVGLAALCLAVAEMRDALAARPDLNATELEASDHLSGRSKDVVTIVPDEADHMLDAFRYALGAGHIALKCEWAPAAASPSMEQLDIARRAAFGMSNDGDLAVCSPLINAVRGLRANFERQVVELADAAKRERALRDTIVANEARIAELERELAKPLAVRAVLINNGIGNANWAVQVTRDGEPVPNSGTFVSR